MGLFITLEGPEGCGKTTQAARLAEHLRQRGFSVLTTREPGGSLPGDRIRALLLDPGVGSLDPVTELLLFNAARREHVQRVILPALEQGKVVVCDRYIDSTLAYQHYGRGLDRQMVTDINHRGCAGLFPHLTIFLDVPPEEGLLRVKDRNASRGQEDVRFDEEPLELHQRVYHGYLEEARSRCRIVPICGTGGTDDVAARIQRAVDSQCRLRVPHE